MDRSSGYPSSGPISARSRLFASVATAAVAVVWLVVVDVLLRRAGADESTLRWLIPAKNIAFVACAGIFLWRIGTRRFEERARLAHELAASRRQAEDLALAVEGAQWLWNLDAQGGSGLVYANEGFRRVWGRPPESLGSPAELFCSGEAGDCPGFREEDWRAFLTGKLGDHFDAEFRLQRPDGSSSWVFMSARLARDELGKPVRVAGMTREIERRKAIEAAAARSEHLYRSLFNLGQEAIARCDLEGLFVEVNAAFCSLTGYEEAELLGTPFQALTRRGWKTEERRIIKEQVIDRGYSDVYEKECRCKDGSIVPVNVRMSVYRDRVGEPVGMFAIVRDITPEKEQNRELVRAKESAESARDAQNRFLTVVTHDLRTPLNPVIGYADLLLSRTTDLEHRDFLHIIHDSASDMVQIIEDIMDYARIENGETVLETSVFRLEELLESLRGQSDRLARLNGNKFRMRYGWKNCAIRGDRTKIRKILGNLISNASKYTRGGTIELRCDLFSGTGEQAVFRFEVEDSGVGIDASRMDSIFRPFREVEETNGKGVGLGLAVCQRLVAAMGGRISARSKVGIGATFRIDLPLPVEAVDESEEARSRPRRPSLKRGHRVLIVEDDEANLALAKDVLSRFGCEVSTAVNGAESLELLKKSPFDLVLMDLSMPFMDGYEATNRLRRDGGINRDVPVVAVTAFSARLAEADCFENGMNDILMKPVTIDAFEDLLRKWL